MPKDPSMTDEEDDTGELLRLGYWFLKLPSMSKSEYLQISYGRISKNIWIEIKYSLQNSIILQGYCGCNHCHCFGLLATIKA